MTSAAVSTRMVRHRELMSMARANTEQSRHLIARARAALQRRAAILHKAATWNPRCAGLEARWVSDSPVTAGTTNWLLAIASVLKDWPTMAKDDISDAVADATPADALAHIVDRHVPRDLRAGVLRALPVLIGEDFAHAAWQIRQAAVQHPA